MTTMTDQSILSTPYQLLEKILSSEEVFKEDITTTLVFADKELRTLREQNKRLREALERIVEDDVVELGYDPLTGEKIMDGHFATIARQTLKECGE